MSTWKYLCRKRNNSTSTSFTHSQIIQFTTYVYLYIGFNLSALLIRILSHVIFEQTLQSSLWWSPLWKGQGNSLYLDLIGGWPKKKKRKKIPLLFLLVLLTTGEDFFIGRRLCDTNETVFLIPKCDRIIERPNKNTHENCINILSIIEYQRDLFDQD